MLKLSWFKKLKLAIGAGLKNGSGFSSLQDETKNKTENNRPNRNNSLVFIFQMLWGKCTNWY